MNPKSLNSHPFQKRILRKHISNAVFKQSDAPDQPEEDESTDAFFVLSKQLDAFYRFTRFYSLIGTIVGISSISLLTVESVADLSPVFLAGLLKALLACLLMNIYFVGINEMFDIEIDKINRPRLPLASGELSMKNGILIVAASATMSLALGLYSRSPPLLIGLLIHFFVGIVYNVPLPFLRWKKYPFLAASCLLSTRGIVLQLAYFLHMKVYVLGRPAVLTKPVLFATAFMCSLFVVIAFVKDIPDIDGDRAFGVQTLSVRLGAKRVFWLCINILLTAYAAAMLLGASSPNLTRKFITVLGHGLLAALLWFRALSTDVHNKAVMNSFYIFIWQLLYAEYFLIHFMH